MKIIANHFSGSLASWFFDYKCGGDLMTVRGVIIRFSIYYPILIILASLVIKLSGLKLGSGINVGVVVFILILLVEKFAKGNKRYFDKKEFNNVFAGVLLLDIFYQVLFLLLSGPYPASSIYYLIFSLILISSLHGIVIYAILKFMKKNLLKRKIIIDSDVNLKFTRASN